MVELGGATPERGDRDGVVAAVEAVAPPGAGTEFPWKPWLCGADAGTARPGSLAASEGVTPGALTRSPVVGFTFSMRFAVSSPPWRKVEVLTTAPPQLLSQAIAAFGRCGRGIQPTQLGP